MVQIRMRFVCAHIQSEPPVPRLTAESTARHPLGKELLGSLPVPQYQHLCSNKNATLRPHPQPFSCQLPVAHAFAPLAPSQPMIVTCWLEKLRLYLGKNLITYKVGVGTLEFSLFAEINKEGSKCVELNNHSWHVVLSIRWFPQQFYQVRRHQECIQKLGSQLLFFTGSNLTILINNTDFCQAIRQN